MYSYIRHITNQLYAVLDSQYKLAKPNKTLSLFDKANGSIS